MDSRKTVAPTMSRDPGFPLTEARSPEAGIPWRMPLAGPVLKRCLRTVS